MLWRVKSSRSNYAFDSFMLSSFLSCLISSFSGGSGISDSVSLPLPPDATLTPAEYELSLLELVLAL